MTPFLFDEEVKEGVVYLSKYNKAGKNGIANMRNIEGVFGKFTDRHFTKTIQNFLAIVLLMSFSSATLAEINICSLTNAGCWRNFDREIDRCTGREFDCHIQATRVAFIGAAGCGTLFAAALRQKEICLRGVKALRKQQLKKCTANLKKCLKKAERKRILCQSACARLRF